MSLRDIQSILTYSESLHVNFLSNLLCNISLSDISAIAVTVGPGLEGALLVGITAASTLSQQLAARSIF